MKKSHIHCIIASIIPSPIYDSMMGITMNTTDVVGVYVADRDTLVFSVKSKNNKINKHSLKPWLAQKINFKLKNETSLFAFFFFCLTYFRHFNGR